MPPVVPEAMPSQRMSPREIMRGTYAARAGRASRPVV